MSQQHLVLLFDLGTDRLLCPSEARVTLGPSYALVAFCTIVLGALWELSISSAS